MVQGIAITTDTCRQLGDGAGYRAHAVDKELIDGGGESQASFQG